MSLNLYLSDPTTALIRHLSHKHRLSMTALVTGAVEHLETEEGRVALDRILAAAKAKDAERAQRQEAQRVTPACRAVLNALGAERWLTADEVRAVTCQGAGVVWRSLRTLLNARMVECNMSQMVLALPNGRPPQARWRACALSTPPPKGLSDAELRIFDAH